jgi:hypothetical protein
MKRMLKLLFKALTSWSAAINTATYALIMLLWLRLGIPALSIAFLFLYGMKLSSIIHKHLDDHLKESQRKLINSQSSLLNKMRLTSIRKDIFIQELQSDLKLLDDGKRKFYAVEVWCKLQEDISILEDTYIQNRTLGDASEEEGVIIQKQIKVLENHITQLKDRWVKSIEYN